MQIFAMYRSHPEVSAVQAVQEDLDYLDCLALEDGTDRRYRNVCN